MSTPKEFAPGVVIDVDNLIETRMLIQANSGGGKSHALRKLCEVTYGATQQIIIDVEDEFHTLRERYDYVLAGQRGGDCPADCKSAAMLARRLLELNVSAIISIYELGAQRQRFVKLFLEALLEAPRELWHPALIVLDEAHLFAPEQGHGNAMSTGAVIDLMTRGRKRGFAGVLATQRISSLSKSAAAECNNKLIGRCSIDVDRKRAAAELGIDGKKEILSLRTLKPGEFYAFGPSLSDEVTTIKVGAVATSHPRAGQRSTKPTPPRERVKKILAQLADLPQEAAEELKTVAELQGRVRALEQQVKDGPAPAPAKPAKVIEKSVVRDQDLARIEKLTARVDALSGGLADVVSDLQGLGVAIADAVRSARAPIPEERPAARPIPRHPWPVDGGDPNPRFIPAPKRPARHPAAVTDDGKGLGKCARAILYALGLRHPTPLSRIQAATLAGYSHTSSGYGNALSELNTAALIHKSADGLALTALGLEASPPTDQPADPSALLDVWVRQLKSPKVGAMLSALVEAGSEGLERSELAEQVNLSPTSSGYGNNLSKLNSNGLIRKTGTRVVADSLFLR